MGPNSGHNPPGSLPHRPIQDSKTNSYLKIKMLAKKAFLKLPLFAVVGASNDRSKFGNKVLRAYQEHSFKAIPISKKQDVIEGVASLDSLTTLANKVTGEKDFQTSVGVNTTALIGVSIVTPPAATRLVLEEGLQLGYTHFFLQPGTCDDAVQDYILEAKKANQNLNIIQSCLLVELGVDPHA